MNRRLRRLLYFSITIAWLIVMSFPILAFFLATQTQVRLGDESGSYVRLFLIQESETEGVGIEWKRPSRQRPTCYQTTIHYLMWEGEAETAGFCQCTDPSTGSPLPAQPQSCTLP